MSKNPKNIIIVGGGTSGSVLAARLSADSRFAVILLEMGPDDDTYGPAILEPERAPDSWLGAPNVELTLMADKQTVIPAVQGRMMGGTSAVNGMATLRGMPSDYDSWEAAGLNGWGWKDVSSTFIAAERDLDFGSSPIHGSSGPLPVRRWRREELGHAQRAYYDGMVETGNKPVTDINDPSQLPGIGVFPVTIDENNKRVSTSLAYLTADVRARNNLTIRTGVEVTKLNIEAGRATGVTLATGEEIQADEVVVSAGALWTPNLLMRSGIGPADHLKDHGISVHADLPVGETMSDHLGPGILYGHEGPRGGTAGPAQVLLFGASNGVDVDTHTFPIAPMMSDGPTEFVMAIFLLKSSGLGSVRLGGAQKEAPIVTVPPLPDNASDCLTHAFKQLAAWEKSSAAQTLGCAPVDPINFTAASAPADALERLTVSYGHMTSTCPMGKVLDADCRVLGIEGLRVADASVMPTIPAGNTYLGCVMIAEQIARKMIAA